MKNVLITGGAGYIGSHAVERFVNEGFNVLVLDNFSTGYRESIETHGKKVEIIEVDLRNYKNLKKKFQQRKLKKIDTVIHFAAHCSVGESMLNPGLYFENNTNSTNNLLKLMTEFDMKNIVFSSSCAVYGETEYLPVDEKHKKNPTNPYGESKLMSEKIIEWYSKVHNIKYVILRYFNVSGASESGIIGDSKRPSPHLIQNAIKGALGFSEFNLTCPVVDSPDGTPIRDYIHVIDLIDAHYKAYQYLSDNGKNIELNLGQGNGFSVMEIINKVEKKLKVTLPKERGEVRKGEYAAIYADIKLAKKTLKWVPKRNLNNIIETLVAWYQKNPNGFAN